MEAFCSRLAETGSRPCAWEFFPGSGGLSKLPCFGERGHGCDAPARNRLGESLPCPTGHGSGAGGVKDTISKLEAKKKIQFSEFNQSIATTCPRSALTAALEVLSSVSRAPNNDQQKPREEEPQYGLAGEDGCAHLAGRGGTRVWVRTPPPPGDQNATIFHIKALPSKPNNKRGDMTRQSRYGRGQRLFASATVGREIRESSAEDGGGKILGQTEWMDGYTQFV
ncbi:hypothetical protein B0T18DRAFT_227454 [Schizothecium vesticola]|uniref:Uncharacterized protein n=1 Tax=Schizothecium vesticola TaxID=314040 RepID=A0AA40EKX2_9PEZI|nr:hypothetical protein B0T18DRAFT_227454 [Schizothecium vesticola]